MLKEMCTVEAQGGIISEPILEEFGQRIELLSVLVQNICQGLHQRVWTKIIGAGKFKII